MVRTQKLGTCLLGRPHCIAGWRRTSIGKEKRFLEGQSSTQLNAFPFAQGNSFIYSLPSACLLASGEDIVALGIHVCLCVSVGLLSRDCMRVALLVSVVKVLCYIQCSLVYKCRAKDVSVSNIMSLSVLPKKFTSGMRICNLSSSRHMEVWYQT